MKLSMWNSVKQCKGPVSSFYKIDFRSAVFLPCSASRELWMKPFLSGVLTSAVCCPVLVQQFLLVDCPLVLFGAKGKSWSLDGYLKYGTSEDCLAVVESSNLEHLEKPLHRIILPSTFHDNVPSVFEFLSLGSNDPRMWTGTKALLT